MDIRAARPGDLDRLMEIEALTFPPVEAAPRATFAFRIAHFPEWFYVAEEGGEIVGLLNGRRTPHDFICDELYEPEGASYGDCFALLCVETDPAWQGRGVAAALIGRMLDDARSRGVTCVTLACKDRLVPYYAKFGFARAGLSQSQHGGAVWNDMKLVL